MRPAERIIVFDLKIAVGVLIEVHDRLVGNILRLSTQEFGPSRPKGEQATADWPLCVTEIAAGAPSRPRHAPRPAK